MNSLSCTLPNKVLIVEDDKSISTFLCQALKLKGIPVIIAENGAQAIELATGGGISLMTIDYSLPDMTGEDVVLRLRKSGIDLPFIMITGIGDEDVAVSSMKLGARDYLVKNDNLFDRVPRVVSEILDKLEIEEQLRKVRAALDESEERFSKVFHNSNDGIFLLHDDLSVLDLNSKARSFLGYDTNEEISKQVLDTLISPAIKSSLNTLRQGKEDNPVYRFEAVFLQKNGGSFLADVVSSIFNVNSKGYILLNFRDISERLLNLEALKNAADEWRNTFDSISDLVSVHDRDMRIIKVNKAFADFVGRPYTEIIGQKCFEVLHPNGINFDSCPHRITINQGRVVTEEVYHPEIGIPLLVTTSPIFNDMGEITGSVHIAKDISELKNARENVEKRERFLRDVLDGIQDGITILDTEFRIVQVNQFVEKKYAFRMPLQGKHCYDVFQNRDEPCELCPTRRTLETKEASSEILSFKTPGKKVCGWVEVSTYPLIDEDSGEVKGVIEYMHDITRRLKVEKSVMESEEKYRILFDDADDAIMVVNADTGIIAECNKAAEILTGRDKDELVGLHQRQLYPPETREEGEFSESFARHREMLVGETISVRILRKDDTLRDVSVRASKISYNDENFLLGVFRDITDIKRINERIKQAQKLESIGTLAGGIAHDFNNILSAVIGFSEIIKTDLQHGQQVDVEDIEGILEAARRATELVRQVLTFSRQSDVEQVYLDITPIIKETVKFLKASLPSTITIEDKLYGPFSTIYADPVQMHQIAMNLCTNAHHAMRKSGGTLSVGLDEITLTAEYIGEAQHIPPGEYVRLTVSDTGHGIDEVTLPKIFDPYFSTKSRDEGTGLGLSVIHGIVQHHGGTINVYSAVDVGTTFRVYLPVARREDKSSDKVEEADSIVIGNERILLVDDEESIARTAARILSRLGYDVTACTDSEHCLDLFRNTPGHFDLVLTDLTMPKITGLDFAREIKLLSPQTPVILMTGFANALDEDKLSDYNIDYLVKKPVLKKDISAAIRLVLDRMKEKNNAEEGDSGCLENDGEAGK